MSKTDPGNFFNDFKLGDEIRHATPRTLTEGDRALYTALYPDRRALFCSDSFARQCGLPRAPLDPLIGFHVGFGKTVPDLSLNAVANLGYAECRFHKLLYPGDEISSMSRVIGLRENSNRRTGVVWVRSRAEAEGETVIDWARWVMVRKSDAEAPAPEPLTPELRDVVPGAKLVTPEGLDFSNFDFGAAGEPWRWEDYEIGERIDHVDGVTIEEAEHMLATRLWQNTAKVHFNVQAREDGRRLIYGGHVISLARALSFNGLANACVVAAINGGAHAAPCFAGDTVYAWSEILDKAETANPSIGALRMRLVGVANTPARDFPHKLEDGKYAPGVLLDLDFWAFIPR